MSSEPLRLVDADGNAVGDTDVGLDRADLRSLYRWMLFARHVDRECNSLQRDGELTVYPGFEGQEAAQVGSAFALGKDDFVFPTFRELAAAVVRGVDPVQYLWYHRGTWHGGAYDPRATRFGPICIPTATQIPHAVGHALGQKLDGLQACTLVYFGDGSASEGDFHEGANLAGVWRAPVILFCQNNGWAISVPTSEQTAGTIHERAPGYGIASELVDGNDVLAVYAATNRARERALAGDGATLIEAMTYRIGAHTTADDASRYRADAEVKAARAADPIARYRKWLSAARAADDEFFAGCDLDIARRVAEIREAIIATPPPDPGWIFDWAYADPPDHLLAQRTEAVGG